MTPPGTQRKKQYILIWAGLKNFKPQKWLYHHFIPQGRTIQGYETWRVGPVVFGRWPQEKPKTKKKQKQ